MIGSLYQMAISNAKYECFAELLHQCEMLILLKKIKACRCGLFFTGKKHKQYENHNHHRNHSFDQAIFWNVDLMKPDQSATNTQMYTYKLIQLYSTLCMSIEIQTFQCIELMKIWANIQINVRHQMPLSHKHTQTHKTSNVYE